MGRLAAAVAGVPALPRGGGGDSTLRRPLRTGQGQCLEAADGVGHRGRLQKGLRLSFSAELDATASLGGASPSNRAGRRQDRDAAQPQWRTKAGHRSEACGFLWLCQLDCLCTRTSKLSGTLRRPTQQRSREVPC